MSAGYPIAKRRCIDSSGLHVIIVHEDKSTILEILRKQGGSLGIRDTNGDSLLHSIFRNDKLSPDETVEVFKTLLGRGVDPNIRNKNGVTVLHLAVEKRMKEVIELLIKFRAQVDVIDYQGNTPLHYFVNNEYEKYLGVSHYLSRDHLMFDKEKTEKDTATFVELLITEGFDFDRLNNDGESALHLAIKHNLQHILPTILKHSKNVKIINSSNENLLHVFLKINGLSSTQTGNSKFSRQYSVDIVKILLDRCISVDTVSNENKTPLGLALQSNEDVDIIKILLKKFKNIQHKNKFGQTLLHQVIDRRLPSTATTKDHLKIIRTLIKKGCDVNDKDISGIRPIHLVAKKLVNNEKLYDLLVNAGCELNALDNDGRTALHWAVNNSNILIVRKLIENGANVNFCDDRQKITPLHLAAMLGSLDIVKLLINNGANVNCKNSMGGRPLHSASNLNMKLLLDSGALVDALTYDMQSALSRAIKFGNYDNVKLLLKYGADINSKYVIKEVLELEKYKWKNNTRLTRLISKQWIKLQVAELPCSKIYEKVIVIKQYERFHQKCLKEIEILKNISLDGKSTIYDFLYVNINDKFVRISNDIELKDLIESSFFQKEFPIYSNNILTKYRKAVARISLLELAKDAWLELTGIRLPEICIERILYYVSNVDLSDMI